MLGAILRDLTDPATAADAIAAFGRPGADTDGDVEALGRNCDMRQAMEIANLERYPS